MKMSQRIVEREKQRHRRIVALQRYCQFDKSDPFAFARGIAHIESGIVGYPETDNNVFRPEALYDAKVGKETRSYVFDGREVVFTATVYKNAVRP